VSSARHFSKPGTHTPDELKAQIAADATAARTAQRDLQVAGQDRMAGQMAAAVDEHLDELNAVSNGTWRPKHA
jgi:hypothetical protein